MYFHIDGVLNSQGSFVSLQLTPGTLASGFLNVYLTLAVFLFMVIPSSVGIIIQMCACPQLCLQRYALM